MSGQRATRRPFRDAMVRLPLMVRCREIEDFILDYIDGTLPMGQRMAFELHLLVCRDCRKYIAAYRRSIALARAAAAEPEKPPVDIVPADLITAILAARDERPPRL
ncbi:MAG: zf-HC2 domain-containing protein [Kiloniellales bacterium]|nr:zf-HC2 domain-containing protein [Kiloniellales bacterium]